MTRRRKQNIGNNSSEITVETVRAAHFKRLTHQKLTNFEQPIVEKYYFADDKIIPRVKYKAVPIEEIRKQIAKGLAPRTTRKVHKLWIGVSDIAPDSYHSMVDTG